MSIVFYFNVALIWLEIHVQFSVTMNIADIGLRKGGISPPQALRVLYSFSKITLGIRA